MMDDKEYPDTAQGAIQCLRDDSTLKLDGATARPDPSVAGVWMVMLDREKNDGMDTAIVYLGGYADPFGREREGNDFEVGEAR
jgi:hypothetical protein